MISIHTLHNFLFSSSFTFFSFLEKGRKGESECLKSLKQKECVSEVFNNHVYVLLEHTVQENLECIFVYFSI